MADYATLLRDHTRLTCRSLDRIFLQGYMPGLQTPGQVARFLLRRGYPMRRRRPRLRIPTESGHPFRLNPGTCSDESGHPWKEAVA
jgi:hypothetical protein